MSKVSIENMLQMKDIELTQQQFEMIVLQLQTNPMINGLIKDFFAIDKDQGGFISMEELRNAFKKNGFTMSETEFEEVYKAIDLDDDGNISYSEFLVAAFNKCMLDEDLHIVEDKSDRAQTMIDAIKRKMTLKAQKTQTDLERLVQMKTEIAFTANKISLVKNNQRNSNITDYD